MRLRRYGLGGLLLAVAGLVLLDVLAPATASRVLGSLLTDPAHRLRDTHVALRTAALLAALAWGFGRFGVVALYAAPLLIGPLSVAALPPVTGDEPHYLMITTSLEHDHDFAVRNNYAQGDGAAFGYPTLGESPGHPLNSPQSLHYPGAALLALPGWILGGRRWALLGVALLATLLIHEMLALSRLLAARPGSAVLAAGMVTLTPPVLLLMRQVYPDVPAAFCLAHLARRLAETEARRRGAEPAGDGKAVPAAGEGAGAVWTVAAVAAAGPWLHARLIVGVFVLVGVLAVRDRRMRIVPPLALAASLGLMAVAFQHWYGSPLPNAPYVNFPARNPSPLRGLVGMFADNHAGLVLVAPVMVVALVAVPALWRTSRWWFLSVGAVVGAAVAQNSAFSGWTAGFSTSARPWTALLPLGVPLVALAVERIPRVMAAAGVWTAAVTVSLLALPPLSYPNLNGLTGLWAHFHLTFLPVIDSALRAQHTLGTPVVNAALMLSGLGLLLTLASRALWSGRSPRGTATGAGRARAGDESTPAASR